MSRIEEALRRARAGSPDPASEPAATTPGAPASSATPSDDIVETPWAFDVTPAPAKVASATPRSRDAAPSIGAVPPPSGSSNGNARSASAAPTATRRPMVAPEPRLESTIVPDPQDPDAYGVFGGFDPSVDERVTVSKGIPPVSVEQYRRLAATLHHAQADRGVRSVMLTSAVTGEGKSLTATNLALTLSQSYRRRVLLIDADLRRPSMHRIFQVPNVSGLTDGLKQPDERKLAIIEIADRLALLTAGRPDPDPMGGLVSDRMRRILDEATTKFDWVVIDTPPVALLPDANVLAAMVDVALLVVGATDTPYDLVQRAVDSIGRDKIMGVVLNRVENTGFAGDARYHAYYANYTNR